MCTNLAILNQQWNTMKSHEIPWNPSFSYGFSVWGPHGNSVGVIPAVASSRLLGSRVSTRSRSTLRWDAQIAAGISQSIIYIVSTVYYIYICMYVHIYIYICMYVHIYIYVHIMDIYIYMYIYIYVCTYIHILLINYMLHIYIYMYIVMCIWSQIIPEICTIVIIMNTSIIGIC